ncbi:MAG TPA: hypothetical protein ENN80_02255 [Candidatus Hydrogenedentes bacterium]|nr:hypothetical protein [Candidatus Hydrogenedentota bacterium]
MDLEGIARVFSGYSYLTLNFRSPRAGALALTPLLGLPITLTPVIATGRIAADDFALFFGPHALRLDVSFRLGEAAFISLPVPQDAGMDVVAVGVVSAFSYGSVDQGLPLCEVTLKSGEETVETLWLESGVTTARADYDFHSHGYEKHEKITVIESIQADYLNVDGVPFMKHKYAALLEVQVPAAHIDAIAFRATSDVILDIYDVALLDAPAPEDSPLRPAENDHRRGE